MSSDDYGPCLPPGFGQSTNQETDVTVGPVLPPHLRKQSRDTQEDSTIGPVLPPHLQKQSKDTQEDSTIGPVLPPHLQKQSKDTQEDSTIGPVLPPHLRKSASNSADRPTIGPISPPNLKRVQQEVDDEKDDEDDETIGPLPCEMFTGSEAEAVAMQLERRANAMKNRLEGKSDTGQSVKLQRESWMTELPENKLAQSIGLQARTFRARAGPDMGDRSVWTDTPADRERKAKEGKKSEKGVKRTYEETMSSARDESIRREVEQFNEKTRKESLYDMHQKKLQEKKKETANEPALRRPFDREVDLEVNRFDDAKREALIKKSQKLDSRFSHGSTQYL